MSSDSCAVQSQSDRIDAVINHVPKFFQNPTGELLGSNGVNIDARLSTSLGHTTPTVFDVLREAAQYQGFAYLVVNLRLGSLSARDAVAYIDRETDFTVEHTEADDHVTATVELDDGVELSAIRETALLEWETRHEPAPLGEEPPVEEWAAFVGHLAEAANKRDPSSLSHVATRSIETTEVVDGEWAIVKNGEPYLFERVSPADVLEHATGVRTTFIDSDAGERDRATQVLFDALRQYTETFDLKHY